MRLNQWIAPLLIVLTGIAHAAGGERSPRFLVHLLDYLAKDYGGAVSHGKVLSASEYQEQVEFSQSALETGAGLPEIQKVPEIQKKLEKLNGIIHSKGEAEQVAKLAREIQAQVIQVANLELAPTQWPNVKNGQQIFAQSCVACHGATGAGDGPAGVALDPKPANFLDDHMKEISPFQAFNTIRLGVPGTGMAAFHDLSDKEVWDLAFYVVSLRHSTKKAGAALTWDSALLKKVATSSDEKLAADLKNEKQDSSVLIASIRNHSDDDSNGGGSLGVARSSLADALKDYEAGNADSAKTKALKAYLEGIEPIEPRLKATDPGLVTELETKMAAVRGAIEAKKPTSEVAATISTANAEMDEAQKLLSSSAMSPWVAFMGAAAILLREGFEAVLLIIALLGVIRASGSRRAAVWVHGGWIAALGLGGVAWMFSGWLMAISGAQREMMEAVTSLFAVFVLLFVGFWLHSQTEIGRWKSFIHGKVQRALDGKNLWGLASISFLAVFREAFETVLFLRAIWIEGGEGAKMAMAAGVALSLVAVIGMAWAILKFSAKLPIRKLFGASAVIMAVLAVVLTGKGLHSLQETGALTVTNPLVTVHFDLLGLYPTWETLLGQIVILAMVFALWMLGGRPSRAAVSTRASAES